MASDSFKVKKSLHIDGNDTATTEAGDIRFDSSDSKFKGHDGSTEEQVIRSGDLADLTYDNATSGLTATDPKAALDELKSNADTDATNLTNHLNDTTDAHDASAISNTPSGNLAATDVQSALDELQSDVDTRATSSDLSDHIADDNNPHSVNSIQVGRDTAQWNADRIQGADVPAPTSTEDGKALIYNHTSGDFEYGQAGGGGSGINLETEPYAQGGTNSWGGFDDGATAVGVDLTGGTFGGTFTAEPTEEQILNGDFKGAYKMAFTAADFQGHGVSKDYSIPKAMRDKGEFILRLRYSADAAIATGDYILKFYDVSNSTMLTSRGLTDDKLVGLSADGTGYVVVRVPISSTTLTVRVGLMRAVTTATAHGFYFSDVSLGLDRAVDVPIIAEWEEFTLSTTSLAGWASTSLQRAVYRRVHDTFEAVIIYDITGLPTADAFLSYSNILGELGLSVDSTKFTVSDTILTVGTWSSKQSSKPYAGLLQANSSAILFNTPDTQDWLDNTKPSSSWGSGDQISLRFSIPIAEWANSSALMSTTEALNKTSRVLLTSTNAPAIGTSIAKLTFNNELVDSAGAHASGTFTAPESGEYEYSGFILTDSESWSAGDALGVRLYVDSSPSIYIGRKTAHTTGSYRLEVPLYGTIELEKGQTVEVWASSPVATNLIADASWNRLTIKRINDFSHIGVYGEYEVVEATDSSSPTISSPALGTWYVPTTTWVAEIGPGTWDFEIETMLQAATSAGVAYGRIGLSTSSTPGTDLFWQGYIGLFGTDLEDNAPPIDKSVRNYTTAEAQTIYVHFTLINFSGATLSSMRLRNDVVGGKLIAKRAQ